MSGRLSDLWWNQSEGKWKEKKRTLEFDTCFSEQLSSFIDLSHSTKLIPIIMTEFGMSINNKQLFFEIDINNGRLFSEPRGM